MGGEGGGVASWEGVVFELLLLWGLAWFVWLILILPFSRRWVLVEMLIAKLSLKKMLSSCTNDVAVYALSNYNREVYI